MSLKLKSSGGGSVTLDTPSIGTDLTVTLPSTPVNLSLAVTSSTTNTNTNKIAVVINGTTYYLLASTSPT